MKPSTRNLELIITSALMVLMVVLLGGVGFVMMLMGGVFLPLSLSDTQLWSVLSPPFVIGMLAGYVVIGGVACAFAVRYARRGKAAHG